VHAAAGYPQVREEEERACSYPTGHGSMAVLKVAIWVKSVYKGKNESSQVSELYQFA